MTVGYFSAVWIGKVKLRRHHTVCNVARVVAEAVSLYMACDMQAGCAEVCRDRHSACDAVYIKAVSPTQRPVSLDSRMWPYVCRRRSGS